MSILLCVLRLGHRRMRDARVTTHVALVARAFGADCIVVSGDEDDKLLRGVEAVVGNWGGKFSITQEKNYIAFLKRKKEEGYKIAHLTMYGERLQDCTAEIRKCRDLVVVVGSQKVPIEVYHLADFNISVTSQPHSEIAALAMFLDRKFDGKELEGKYDGKRRIVPSKFGKNVLSCGERGQV